MPTVYYTASSLDGFVVDTDDSLDWLMRNDVDGTGFGGYDDFIADVGAIVMGAATHRWLIEHEPDVWPYEQPTWVVTNHPDTVTADGVRTYAGDVTELHPRLVDAAQGRDVWVVGGGDLAAQFVSAGLVDEMWIHYAPCSLGAGRPVLPTASRWRLLETGRNRDFVGARWARADD